MNNLNYGDSFDPTKGLIEPDSYNPNHRLPEHVGAGYRVLKQDEQLCLTDQVWGDRDEWMNTYRPGYRIGIGETQRTYRRKIEPDYSSPYFKPKSQAYPTSLPGFKYKLGEEVVVTYPRWNGTRAIVVGFIAPSFYDQRGYFLGKRDKTLWDGSIVYIAFVERWLSPVPAEVSETVNGRQVTARPDGSLTVGCTTLSKDEVEKIQGVLRKAKEL